MLHPTLFFFALYSRPLNLPKLTPPPFYILLNLTTPPHFYSILLHPSPTPLHFTFTILYSTCSHPILYHLHHFISVYPSVLQNLINSTPMRAGPLPTFTVFYFTLPFPSTLLKALHFTPGLFYSTLLPPLQ